MGWYRVVKTIKGHRYVYEQRTWREGRHVRTESRYLGPADGYVSSGGAGGGAKPSGTSQRVNTTPIILYHGSPSELTGTLEPSGEGTFGPGFYLTTKERATLYARYDAGIAARLFEGEEGGAPEPQYDGTVYAFDVGDLRLKVLGWMRYQELCMALDPQGASTPSAKAELQALLAGEGYDGLYILDDERHEMVIFPGSMDKIKVIEVNTTAETLHDN